MEAAKPIAMIASIGVALRYSLDMGKLADIKSKGATAVNTTQMGETILRELLALSA